jgi:hypothetical protein
LGATRRSRLSGRPLASNTPVGDAESSGSTRGVAGGVGGSNFAGPSLGTGLADGGRWPGWLGKGAGLRSVGDAGSAWGGVATGRGLGCCNCCDAAGSTARPSMTAARVRTMRGIDASGAMTTPTG